MGGTLPASWGSTTPIARPLTPPMLSLPPLTPLPSQVFATTVAGIELVRATILVTVLVLAGWDRRHVAPDSRKFSTCGATSHLEHSICSWHDIVLCMIVFVLWRQVAKHGSRRNRTHHRNRTPEAPPQMGGGGEKTKPRDQQPKQDHRHHTTGGGGGGAGGGYHGVWGGGGARVRGGGGGGSVPASYIYIHIYICIYIYIYVCRTFWVYLGIVSSYDYIKYYIHIIFRIFKLFSTFCLKEKFEKIENLKILDFW